MAYLPYRYAQRFKRPTLATSHLGLHLITSLAMEAEDTLDTITMKSLRISQR